MRPRLPHLIANIALAFATGCAFLSGLARVAGPLACDAALVEVRDPETHAVMAALCPVAAKALADILAEEASAGGNAGKSRARKGTCGKLPVHVIDPNAPTGEAHYCADRLGGAVAATELHAKLMARLATVADAGADGGR